MKTRKFDLPLFLTLAAAIAVFFLLLRIQEAGTVVNFLFNAVKPVLIGAAIAYVLCPVAKRIEKGLRRDKKLQKAARGLSVLLTMLLALALIVLFCALVLPQLVDSVGGLADQLPGMLQTQLNKLNEHLSSDSSAAESFMQTVESVENSVMAWIKTNMFSAVSNVAGKVKDIGSSLISLVVSIVITVYLLLDRERYTAQCKKLWFAVSKNERVNRAVADALRQTDRIFSGFISGKLLDSLIVGIICFICLLVLKMPYAMLISVIVGVTNVIPMFGPVLGAIPGAFLLLLISPKKALIFLVFIVILQQIDGNVIGPKILGNSTGISALYITVAMLVFGKLLGFFGMLVGVPLMATLYYIIKRLAEHSLRKQGLPTETAAYQPVGTEISS